MPPGPRADQAIDDNDELSHLEFTIVDMMAAAEAANIKEEPIAEQRPQASGSADRPRTKKARRAPPLSGTQDSFVPQRVLWCLDVTPSRAPHSASKRKTSFEQEK